MSTSIVNLDYRKCRPDQCGGGACPAVEACSLKLLQQEEQFDYPFAGHNLCKGCAKCVTACPLNAIELA